MGTTWKRNNKTLYNLYSFLGNLEMTGTVDELADFLGVQQNSIYAMLRRTKSNPDAKHFWRVEVAKSGKFGNRFGYGE